MPEELRGIVTLAYYTGWRIASEILSLQWAQVDRERQIIRLEPGTTKNAEGRTLPYGRLPELVALVEAAWATHETLKKAGTICPFVFQRSGSQIKDFRGAWAHTYSAINCATSANTACIAAGCPGKLLHDFRRTAVRNLVRRGVPETQAMAITGHKTRSVFDRYDIVNEADLRDALGKLTDAPVTEPATPGKVEPFKDRRARA